MQNKEIDGAVDSILKETARLGVTVEFGDASVLPTEAYYVSSTRQIYVCEQSKKEQLFSLVHELGHAVDFIRSGLLDVFLDIVLFPLPKVRYIYNEKRAWKLGERWIPEQMRPDYRAAAQKDLASYKKASLAAIRKESCVLPKKHS